MDDSPIIVLGVSTIIYVCITVFIAIFLNQAIALPFDPLGGEGYLHYMWQIWLTVGAILGVGDLIAILNLFAGATPGR